MDKSRFGKNIPKALKNELLKNFKSNKDLFNVF